MLINNGYFFWVCHCSLLLDWERIGTLERLEEARKEKAAPGSSDHWELAQCPQLGLLFY